MRALPLLGFALALLASVSCGGGANSDITPPPSSPAPDDEPALDGGSDGGGESSGSDARADARPPVFDEGDDPGVEIGDDEDDPESGPLDCEDVSIPPEPPKLECDAFAPHESSGCGAGKACFPYVIKAAVDCGPASYGTRCMSAGSRKQGKACQYVEDCAHGFVCRISGAGRQCTALCDIDAIGSCGDGLVCLPFDDLPGFGGCM